MRIGLTCLDGRAPREVLDLLRAAGVCGAELDDVLAPALVEAPLVVEPSERPESRPAGPQPGAAHTWFLAPAGDVLTACVRGALDAGIAGKDELLELAAGTHELLELPALRDTLVYVVPERAPARGRRGRPRVATRYPRATSDHFAGRGLQAEIVEFSAPALAVGLGLADGAVELRSRLPEGRALVERAQLASCSARLVCSRAARTLATPALEDLLKRLRAQWEAS